MGMRVDTNLVAIAVLVLLLQGWFNSRSQIRGVMTVRNNADVN